MQTEFCNNAILEYLYGLKSEKFSFHPDLIEQLCEASPSQIDWLERRIGSTRPGDRSGVHPAAVRSLKELMRPSPETLDTLAETVGLSPSGLTSADQIVGDLRELGKRAA
ncbi:hypothetical protein [Poseidonocella sp. HB161398]|uniref:hypothetical protein n=1 Tax=Poseidonocella sp. HB161398 TaxID=2320855 RepID=UPI00110962F0|nr:hypothetical protein [Poseidonocella sp. HB161398]